MSGIKPFKQPIYITRPLLPDLNKVQEKLKEIWDSKWLTNNGIQHQLLEEELSEFLKVPYLSLFNNGTIALIVACQSLRLSGDVITTPFTFPATVHVLSWNNIKPVFCDIDHRTMNIDPDKIEALITPQTTAILGVHIFGTPCDVFKIQEIADRYGLRVVYDAAHVFSVEIDGRGIGTFGDISMFSFHATKIYHTAEGGALTFNDPNLKPRIDFLKNFGIKNEDEVAMVGINGKMNEIQAALGLLNLEHLEDEINKRKNLMDTYRTCLKDIDGVSFLNDVQNVNSGFQHCVIRIDKRLFGKSRDYVYKKFMIIMFLPENIFIPFVVITIVIDIFHLLIMKTFQWQIRWQKKSCSCLFMVNFL